jgi:hypothetical protein
MRLKNGSGYTEGFTRLGAEAASIARGEGGLDPSIVVSVK